MTHYGDGVYVDDRTIDSHIKRLRKKFWEKDQAFDLIEMLLWCRLPVQRSVAASAARWERIYSLPASIDFTAEPPRLTISLTSRSLIIYVASVRRGEDGSRIGSLEYSDG
jgi:hypothetical protein